MLGKFQTVFVLALGTFALVLVVASAVRSELSLSFSDDMSHKGGSRVLGLYCSWTKVKLIDLRFEGRRVPVLLCESRETRRGIGYRGMHLFGEQK